MCNLSEWCPWKIIVCSSVEMSCPKNHAAVLINCMWSRNSETFHDGSSTQGFGIFRGSWTPRNHQKYLCWRVGFGPRSLHIKLLPLKTSSFCDQTSCWSEDLMRFPVQYKRQCVGKICDRWTNWSLGIFSVAGLRSSSLLWCWCRCSTCWLTFQGETPQRTQKDFCHDRVLVCQAIPHMASLQSDLRQAHWFFFSVCWNTSFLKCCHRRLLAQWNERGGGQTEMQNHNGWLLFDHLLNLWDNWDQTLEVNQGLACLDAEFPKRNSLRSPPELPQSCLLVALAPILAWPV